MKSFTLLALAAGASATGFSFKNSGSFSCPSNTDNQCTDKQRGGFTWGDLATGSFSSYGGFDFKGWTCKDSFSKREGGRFAPRTGSKAISGVCGSDVSSSPSFGCSSGKDSDKFSVGEIHVQPEFDCDLEFHYDMPGGEKCKQRSSCSSKGSVVTNDQCGGATSVTVVYPSQTGKPKPSCTVVVPTISFSCGSASTTKPPKTTTTSSPAETTTSAAEVTTTSSAEEVTTTSAAETTSAVETTSTVETIPAESTTAVETTSAAVETTSSAEAETTTSAVATTSAIFVNSTTTTAAVESTTSEVVSYSTTEFLSTSTVFSTVVSTITSCAPTVTNCPAHSVTVTTVVVPVSTTICPVTETHIVKPTTTSTESASAPTETLPCPTVVPKCLNTWIFSTGCSDNTDASCYCPDELFVKNVFSCMYSYGETDTIVSEAVVFFQGICAPYIPGNPAIATGAETVTTYITAGPTSVPSAVYTTVTVEQTTVVPCTNSAGETIPSSSSTVVVSTTLTVPQVGFTTTSGGVGVIPVTSYTPVATSPAETGAASETIFTTAAPVSSGVATGTGFFTPTPTPSQVVVSGAGKASTGFGLAGLAIMALVAAL